MNDKKKNNEIPHLKLGSLKLVSIYYRARGDIPADSKLAEEKKKASSDLNISISERRKNSFKVRAKQEIKMRGVLFRATYEAHFESHSPLSDESINNPVLLRRVVDMILPFSSELFANMTAKSFIMPIIVPHRIPPTKELKLEK